MGISSPQHVMKFIIWCCASATNSVCVGLGRTKTTASWKFHNVFQCLIWWLLALSIWVKPKKDLNLFYCSNAFHFAQVPSIFHWRVIACCILISAALSIITLEFRLLLFYVNWQSSEQAYPWKPEFPRILITKVLMQNLMKLSPHWHKVDDSERYVFVTLAQFLFSVT